MPTPVANKKVIELSPDGFSRFFMLVDLLTQLYGGNTKPISILDVGGGSEFFEQQLKKAKLPYDLTVLDIIDKPASITARYIQGDATAMKLADNSYDVVISTDTLEHIPQAKKQAFLDECIRVAKEVCIIAAPFMTDGVDAAEVAVNNFNKKLFDSGQDWLEEHLSLGKPTPELFEKTLRKRKIAYDDFGTQNLTTWLLNTHINLIEAKLGLDEAAHIKVNKYYNEHILEMNECSSPTYRHFYVIYKDPAKRSRVSIDKYTKATPDTAKTVAYTNKLFDLLADRIGELNATVGSQAKSLSKTQQQLADARKDNDVLNQTVQQQAATLKKLEPVIRLGRPVRRIYKRAKK